MQELLTASLRELVARLRAGELSPVELMQATLERIDATHADLNAIVGRRPEDTLIAEARVAEERLARGEGRPLEGVPFGVKDLEDVAGMVTTHGSRLFAGALVDRDSVQVARLRAAGAIVVAKTNTPEFGFTAITKNLLFGETRSPWDLRLTPGGSSGGSAAALAGGVLPLVTASDGGGSVRIPASFVGAFGLKPSFGRIPAGPRPWWSYGDTATHGPLTRTVEDAALILDQVAGPTPSDPKSLPEPGLFYSEEVQKPLEPGRRIAFSPDLGYAVVQSDVAAVVAEAAAVFEQLGHRVEEIAGGPPDLGSDWGELGSFEQASRLFGPLRERREELTRAFARGLDRAWSMTPERWGEAARRRAEVSDWCARLFEDHDLLLTPTVPFDPPPARGPFPSTTEGRPQLPAGVASFTIPFNLSWHPAATVRAGLSQAGLPVGLQIVAPRHRDDLVLRAARDFERARPWHPEWPIDWQSPAES